MSIHIFHDKPWTRHHDPRTTPIRPNVQQITCFDTIEDLINIFTSRPPNTKFKASGSHWGLSEAAISDDEAIETNWPGPEAVPRHSGFDLDLDNFYSDSLFHYLVSHPPKRAETLKVDPCLQQSVSGNFFVHLKSGTRIYEAYSLLDQEGAQADTFAARLNNELLGTTNAKAYDGPWALETMGGAGGQTLFGALTTGTHGGDYRQQSISDSVVAIHLVTEGGAHYWIEPRRNEIPIADDDKLQTYYGNIGGATFSIIRDDKIFDAVVVSAGRFGVIASLVFRVVPQYCLHEHRVLSQWSEVKKILNGPSHHYHFNHIYFPSSNRTEAQNEFMRRFGSLDFENRFLQIAINVSPHNVNEHRCGITQRWFTAHDSAEAKNPDGSLKGRKERGTAATAGKTFPYEPSDDPGATGSSNGTFLQKACASGNFIAGLIRQIADEVQHIIDSGVVVAGSQIASVLGIGFGGYLATLVNTCLILQTTVAVLRTLADNIELLGDASLTQVVNTAIKIILSEPIIPPPVDLMILRSIFLHIFECQQAARDFVAVSYAVMDAHDYNDRSCFGNAESIEVFFDANRPDIYCTYVDQILAFESAQQENDERVTVGYVSLRYVQGSHGLISPSRFAETVVIEVAGIRDAAGTIPFVKNAAQVARHSIFAAPFHWGQFNPLTRSEVDRIFDAAPRQGNLTAWRQALRRFTQNGRLDGFSSAFTRRTGLEL